MRIRRMDVENEIDYAICDKVSIKNRRLVVPELYDSLMNIIVNVLNSDSDDQITDKIYDEFMKINGSGAVWNMLGDYAVNLCSEIRLHFIQEQHDKKFKYKFVKSPGSGTLAMDSVVVDLELTLHWGNVRKRESTIDVLDVVDETPDLDTVNAFYDEQERELKSYRKYSSRY